LSEGSHIAFCKESEELSCLHCTLESIQGRNSISGEHYQNA